MKFPYLKLTSLALATALLLNTQAVLAENVMVKETKEKSKRTAVQGGGDAGGGNAAVKAVSTNPVMNIPWAKSLARDAAKLVPYVLRFENYHPSAPGVFEVKKLTIEFKDKCFSTDEESNEKKKEVTSSATPGGPICLSIPRLIADPKVNEGNIGTVLVALLAHEAGHVAGYMGKKAEADLYLMQQRIVDYLKPDLSFWEADQIRKYSTLELQRLQVELDILYKELDEQDISMSSSQITQITNELYQAYLSFEQIMFQYHISPISREGIRALKTAHTMMQANEGFIVSPKRRQERWSMGFNFLLSLNQLPVGTATSIQGLGIYSSLVYLDAEIVNVGYQDFQNAKRMTKSARAYLDMAVSDLYVSDSLGLGK